jgi:hypothetical protein
MAGGGVIHQLGWSGLNGPLPSLMNNSEIRIRDGERRPVLLEIPLSLALSPLVPRGEREVV